MPLEPGAERPAVLVTGASAGIGRELARVFAARGHPLALTARRRDRLDALAREVIAAYGVKVGAFAYDLADPAAPAQLHAAVTAAGIEVGVLVNNAGFGRQGAFAASDLAREKALAAVNVSALVALTRLVLPAMLARGWGRILNVASTAAFQPGPFMASYYASKAYVLSFTEALHEELRGTGVAATALCPGPVATEFQAVAGMEGVRLTRMLAMTSAERVAQQGYEAAMAGRAIAIPGLMNWLGVQSLRVTPRVVARRLVGWLNRKARR